jgi:hypothetical protein
VPLLTPYTGLATAPAPFMPEKCQQKVDFDADRNGNATVVYDPLQVCIGINGGELYAIGRILDNPDVHRRTGDLDLTLSGGGMPAITWSAGPHERYAYVGHHSATVGQTYQAKIAIRQGTRIATSLSVSALAETIPGHCPPRPGVPC